MDLDEEAKKREKWRMTPFRMVSRLRGVQRVDSVPVEGVNPV